MDQIRRSTRRLKRNYFFRAVSAVIIIAAILIFVPFIVMNVIDFFYRLPLIVYQAPDNAFFEIVIPPQKNPAKENAVFKYSKLVKKSAAKGECLTRKKARHEFVRVLGKNLRQDDIKEPRYLIVGASTVLGAAISRKFAYKGKPFIAVNGINEIDFTSPDAFIPFENITISQAFIVYQPPLLHHSTTDGSIEINSISVNYINKLTAYLNEREIPFVFAPVSPISEETMTTALRNGACVVEVPYMVDKDAFYDLENPTMRAVRECRASGSSIIDFAPTMNYQSIKPELASKFVRHQIKYHDDIKKGRFQIYGKTNISVQEAVRIAVKSAGLSNCNLSFHKSPHTIDEYPETLHKELVEDKNDDENDEIKNDVRKMIENTYSNFNRTEKEKKYFSIVICGRHDNFSKGFEKRAQNFLNRINEAIQKNPLADIEIIFVDYSTDTSKNSLLNEVFEIGENLKNKVSFIVVTQENHNKLIERMNPSARITFLEYVAKNIGIRRAKGKFILTTNPDDLLSDEFFDLIAARQFNTAVVYRATRWDDRNTTYQNQSFEKVVQALNEPWILRELDVKQRCQFGRNRFSIVDSMESFDRNSAPCGVGDFVLLSKKMWDAVEGFNEFPANPNVDTLFLARLMKFVPGYAQMFSHPIIIHQHHVKKNIFRPSVVNHTELIVDYVCSGKCPKCAGYDDIHNWGLSDERFRIIEK